MAVARRRHYNAPMSKSRHVSETPATQFLRRHGVAFGEHPYDYVDHGGTAESARQLGVDEHHVVKTLVMEDEHAKPLIVLMHGDRTVSAFVVEPHVGGRCLVPIQGVRVRVLVPGLHGERLPLPVLPPLHLIVDRGVSRVVDDERAAQVWSVGGAGTDPLVAGAGGGQHQAGGGDHGSGEQGTGVHGRLLKVCPTDPGLGRSLVCLTAGGRERPKNLR